VKDNFHDEMDALIFVKGLKLLLGDKSWCVKDCDITTYKIDTIDKRRWFEKLF
jgi:hypothetical protein